MKLLSFFLALVAVPLLAQQPSVQKIDNAVKLVAPKGLYPLPPVSGVACGLIDNQGNVVYTGKAGAQSIALVAGTSAVLTYQNGVVSNTLTPAQAETVTANTAYPGPVKGNLYSLIVTTSGTSSYTLTFSTGINAKGNLVTGIVSGVTYTILYVFDGTNFDEVSRTQTGSGAGSTVITAPATTMALTAAQSGSTILLATAAGTTVTLPAPVAGLKYTFIVTVTVTSNSDKILTDASSTFLQGETALFISGGAANNYIYNGTSARSVNLNGTTTGGILGTQIMVECINGTQWQTQGQLIGSGTIATPVGTS